MKCERCKTETNLRANWCPDSRRPLTMLCLVCWGDLQIWLKRPPKDLLEDLGYTVPSTHRVVGSVKILLEGQDGQVDHVRPMEMIEDIGRLLGKDEQVDFVRPMGVRDAT